MSLNDYLERVVWTLISAIAGAAATYAAKHGLDIEIPDAYLFAVATAAANAGTIWLRKHVPWLPDPGKGLPGAPVAK